VVVGSVLTDLERRRIRAFNREDGERTPAMRGLATRCRQNLEEIEKDLELIRQFLRHYEQAVGKVN
jgi:hypothetical protein